MVCTIVLGLRGLRLLYQLTLILTLLSFQTFLFLFQISSLNSGGIQGEFLKNSHRIVAEFDGSSNKNFLRLYDSHGRHVALNS